MDSLMGRSGAGTGAANRRALSPLRSRLRPPGSQRNYLSISHLRSLHLELVDLLDSVGAAALTSFSGHGTTLSKRQSRRLIEILRSTAEVVAFGEAGGKSEYFEFFSETATMALFVKALRLGPAIKTQVLQATSILFQNLRSATSLYMLLSQDHINRLIQPEEGAEFPMDDEEFLTNYVALLKMISVRLSKDTLVFFFNAGRGSFPLYSRAVPLIAHQDPMVRTSALNIVLHVLSVDDAGVKAFLAREENYGGFFDQLSRLMQDAYSQILWRMWQAAEPSTGKNTAIDGAASFFQDMLYFVQDVLSVAGPFLSEKLSSHLHQSFFKPVVLGGLAEASGARMAAGPMLEEREPELQLALYALCQFFMLTTDGPLLKLVAAELFGQGGGGGGGIDERAYTDVDASGEVAVGLSAVVDGPGLEGVARGERTTTATSAATVLGGEAQARRRRERRESERYRKALLDCVMWRRSQGGWEGGGAQVRLGAVAVLRSAVNNSTAVSEIVFSGAVTPAAEKHGNASDAVPCSSPTRSPKVDAALDDVRSLSASRETWPLPSPTPPGSRASSGMTGDKRRPELQPVAEVASTGVGSHSVLDFMLPDDIPAVLPVADLGFLEMGGDNREPCVLDFVIPANWSPPDAPTNSRLESRSMDEQDEKKERKQVGGGVKEDEEKDEITVARRESAQGVANVLQCDRNAVSAADGGDGAAGAAGAGVAIERSGPSKRSETPDKLSNGSGPLPAHGHSSGGGASDGDKGGSLSDDAGVSSAGRRPRSEFFQQVMVCLLEALTEPPAADTVAVRTAAAAVEELFVGMSSSAGGGRSGAGGDGGDDGGAANKCNSNRSDASSARDSSSAESAGVDHAASTHAGPPSGPLWGPENRNRRLEMLLTNAYARSAESLLSATTRLYPFALLSACEQAVELLGFGRFGPNRDFRVSSPHPRTSDVAPSVLLVGNRAVAVDGVGVSRSGGGGGEGSELPARRVQNFLVLRSLHRWLVEGSTALDGHAVAAAAAATIPLVAPRATIAAAARSGKSRQQQGQQQLKPSPPTPPSSPAPVLLPGSVRVDAEFLGLVGTAAAGNGAYSGLDDTGGFSLFPSPAVVPLEDEGDGDMAATARAASDTAAFVTSKNPRPTATPWTGGVSGASGGLVVEEVRGVIANSTYIPTKRSDRVVGKWNSVHEAGGGAAATTADLDPPRVGDRLWLSGKRCLTCYLPFNWPGKATTSGAAPRSGASGWSAGIVRSLLSRYSLWISAPAGLPASSSRSLSSSSSGGGSTTGGVRSHHHHHHRRRRHHSQRQSSSASPRHLDLDELYVILDERSLLIAVPDPDSSHNGRGLVVCVAPLRNTAAKVHPANPRVLELRVSTREEGRVGASSGGPGLFLPVPCRDTAAPGIAGGDGGASFRGPGHRGMWHLVLCFEKPGACSLVVENVEEQRRAFLAYPTVGLVELFRRVASMSSGNGSGGGGGGTRGAASSKTPAADAFVK